MKCVAVQADDGTVSYVRVGAARKPSGDSEPLTRWDPGKHPRVAGGPGGGEFTSGAGLPWTPDEAGHVTYHGHLGVDREHMPQLSGTGPGGKYVPSSVMLPQFTDYLRGKGIKVEHVRVPAASLKPTQTTGDAAAIRGIADDLKSGKLADTKPIVVSSDNRVLDGHHNWAGHLLADAEGGRAGRSRGCRCCASACR